MSGTLGSGRVDRIKPCKHLLRTILHPETRLPKTSRLGKDYVLHHQAEDEFEDAVAQAQGCQICATASALGVVLKYPLNVEMGILRLDTRLAHVEEAVSEVSFDFGHLSESFVLRAVRQRGHAPTIIGRAVSIGFDHNLAQQWYMDCVQHHAKCKEAGSGVLPSRLLDLGDGLLAKFRRRLKLIKTSKLKYHYVALSHCWGGPAQKPLTTTEANLSSHQKGIPFSRLPRTFQDAVTVTRTLEFRFLWIDSLCIVQDSTSDWQAESARMGEIYANAAFTIAAADAPNSHAGFLQTLHSARGCNGSAYRIRTYDVEPVRIVVDLGSVEDSCRDVQLVLEDRYSAWSMHGEPISLDGSAKLDTRGWTFQERLLSTRILRFSKHEMSFECNHSRRFERLHPPVMHQPASDSGLNNFPKNTVSAQVSHGSLKDGLWRRLVEEFRMRDLTYAEDQLAALAGIANAVQAATGDRYLAGLWRSSLEQDLLWCRHRISPSEDIGAIAQPQLNFPSWSWASCGSEIMFQEVPAGSYECNLHADDVDAATSTTGSIQRASLALSGYYNTVKSSKTRLSDNDNFTVLTYELPDEAHIVGNIYQDRVGWPWSQIGVADADNLELTFLLQWTSSLSIEHLLMPSYIALILVPVEGHLDTFSRVGLFVSRSIEAIAADQEGGREEQIEKEDRESGRAVEWFRFHGRRNLSLV